MVMVAVQMENAVVNMVIVVLVKSIVVMAVKVNLVFVMKQLSQQLHQQLPHNLLKNVEKELVNAHLVNVAVSMVIAVLVMNTVELDAKNYMEYAIKHYNIYININKYI